MASFGVAAANAAVEAAEAVLPDDDVFGSAAGVITGICIAFAFALDRVGQFMYRRLVPAPEVPLLLP